MGQTARTTRLLLDLRARDQGGANSHKRRYLEETEFQTVETREHPTPLASRNFSRQFPDFPTRYRRSVIKDVIGKARGYLTTLRKWQRSGKKQGKPGVPTASNHPTLYAGTFALELDALDLRESFVRLKVYTGSTRAWVQYPTRYNRYFEQRRAEEGWEQERSSRRAWSRIGDSIRQNQPACERKSVRVPCRLQCVLQCASQLLP